MTNVHSFHLPVMGIGFTIDTPLKVAKYGLDSVIFIGDDILQEKLRKMYSEKYNLPYSEITDKVEDYRAKRITAYLKLIKQLTDIEFSLLLNNKEEIKKYIDLLPKTSILKKEFEFISDINMIDWAKNNLILGDINVNIMTKLDKVNYFKGEALSVEYNDAHAALRAYAISNLKSSVVLSAGMNPRLFTYIEKFDCFYPNENGELMKKITLKVSDYRSALIQGKFLAKKGIWVSEYRIESGLNCGGHAFATEGFLMGPILEEFKKNKNELIQSTYEIYSKALENKNKIIPKKQLNIKISAQGGVGTSSEHDFLIANYNLDSVGWGSPFLLVPEVTNVDSKTLKLLSDAKEKDLYLSNISPLGVPLNNLRGNTKDEEKIALIDKGRPGSKCPKEILALNGEFTDRSICTASRQYQRLKIKEIDSIKDTLSNKEYNKKYEQITEKSCICVGLGTSALIVNNVEHKIEGDGVSICPGPNLAYYSQISTLLQMTQHIYGSKNLKLREDRPNMFIKELSLYLKYLKNKIESTELISNRKEEKFFKNFISNLANGIHYYFDLFENNEPINTLDIYNSLTESMIELSELNTKIENLLLKSV